MYNTVHIVYKMLTIFSLYPHFKKK